MCLDSVNEDWFFWFSFLTELKARFCLIFCLDNGIPSNAVCLLLRSSFLPMDSASNSLWFCKLLVRVNIGFLLRSLFSLGDVAISLSIVCVDDRSSAGALKEIQSKKTDQQTGR